MDKAQVGRRIQIHRGDITIYNMNDLIRMTRCITRIIRLSVMAFGLLATTDMAHAQQAEKAKPLRLFLIGNSFSQNATRYLPQLSKEGGYDLVIGRAELGGCSLQRHWDSVAVSLADTTRGRAYNGKSLKQLLSDGTWDVVTIQQASILSGDTATYEPYASKLYEFIKQLQPNAEVIVHQTWAYRSDAKSFGKIEGEKRAVSQQEMWTYLRSSYHTLADRLHLRIIPSGDALQTVAADAVWGFKKDTAFNSETAVHPALPNDINSLHVGYIWREGTLKFDANHANEAGCYLAGMVWYAFLFGADPGQLKFRPDTVDEEFASYLKKTAYKTANRYL